MNEFWYYLALAICLVIGLRSFISGIRKEKRVLWLSINSANQEHYVKYGATYNIILGLILIAGSSYVIITKLL